MSRHNIAIIIAMFLVIGLALIVINGLDLLGYEGQLVNQYNLPISHEFEIEGGVTIGQTFQAPRDGLQRIDVIFRTFGRRNTHEVIFYLKQSPESSDVIYQETFMASEVRNNQWRTFEFPPIPDSARKTFFFYFASPNSVAGDAITVGGGSGDFYSKGAAYVGSVPMQADVAFRTYYGLSFDEKLSILSKRIVEDKPSIWGDIRFYILLVALYALIMIRFFAELIKLVPRE